MKRLVLLLLIALSVAFSGCGGFQVVTKDYAAQTFATKKDLETLKTEIITQIDKSGYVTIPQIKELLSKMTEQDQMGWDQYQKLLEMLEQTGANKIRAFTTNTGGGAGALDAISCDAPLADYDLGLVFRVSDKTMLFYMYNADGDCEADTDPYLIAPDDCATCDAGNKGQWELFKSFTFAGDDPSTLSFKASDQANQVIARIQADATDSNDSTVIFQTEVDTALATFFTLDGATGSGQVTFSKPIDAGSNTYTSTGYILGGLRRIDVDSTDADDSYTISSADGYGILITNKGDDDLLTVVLPDVVDTMLVCVALYAAYDINIDPNGSERILVDTDTDGDYISSDQVVGSYYCLAGVSATEWMPLGKRGTWTEQ